MGQSPFNVIHWEYNNPNKLDQGASPLREFKHQLLRDNTTKQIKGIRFRWRFRLTAENEEQLINYLAEDDYQIFRKPSETKLKEIIISSYSLFCKEFDKRILNTGLVYSLADVTDNELDIMCLSILETLP